ncbi:MAG: 2-amino-4-hydroxy-6-hydroxymethyldihydropteridine diphosphokinase [Peptococcaceae bacterium]|nr:2-amino-4-hydroxy-6-hydroxymethyldihydropteridine diphosphokinase [Peptococcaceae bacterium]
MRRNPVQAVVSLGSNLGNREDNLRAGARAISKLPGTKVQGVSSLYSTEPLGYLEQDYFLNAVMIINTRMQPLELLRALLAIEADLGRQRLVHWGPRNIDLDLILYGDETMASPELTVPHPRMHERAFVLMPMLELMPDLTVNGNPIGQMLKNTGNQKISLFNQYWFDKL